MAFSFPENSLASGAMRPRDSNAIASRRIRTSACDAVLISRRHAHGIIISSDQYFSATAHTEQ